MQIKKISVLLILIILTYACAPKKEIPLSPEVPLLAQGQRALEHKDYKRAFDLYMKAYSQGLIPENKKTFYLREMILCGEELGYFKEVGRLLGEWKKLSPSAPTTWDYTILYLPYLLSTKGKGPTLDYVISLCRRADISLKIKEGAAFWLLNKYFQDNSIGEATRPFSELYKNLSEEEKKKLEKDLLEFLTSTRTKLPPTEEWKTLREDVFPENLIKWAYLIKKVEKEEIAWPLAYEKLCKILHSDLLIKKILRKQLSSLTQKLGVPVVKMALVLPLGGAYKDISWKIVEGVEAALYEWQKTGIKAQVSIINSLSSMWIKKLKEVLKDSFIVGGPIREEAWKKIKEQGLDKEGAFFLFRSDIPLAQEGIDAFRFFPSHRDQISAVVDFLMKNFNISTYGILYPRGEYGRTLAEEFWSYVTHKGGKITALSWYKPNNPSGWQKRVEDFLQVPPDIFDSKNKTKIENFVPSLDFNAVFLPDSFENIQILVPNFFYFNSYKLFFLGTTLWSNGNFDLTGMDKRLFRLAIFPSPWLNDPQNNPYLLTLKKEVYFLSKDRVSLWNSLGYDFFRFSMELLYRRVKDKAEVRELLPEIDIPWTLAPIRWNKDGIAREQMYLLQPLKQGGVEVDVEKLKKYYSYITGYNTNQTSTQEK